MRAKLDSVSSRKSFGLARRSTIQSCPLCRSKPNRSAVPTLSTSTVRRAYRFPCVKASSKFVAPPTGTAISEQSTASPNCSASAGLLHSSCPALTSATYLLNGTRLSRSRKSAGSIPERWISVCRLAPLEIANSMNAHTPLAASVSSRVIRPLLTVAVMEAIRGVECTGFRKVHELLSSEHSHRNRSSPMTSMSPRNVFACIAAALFIPSVSYAQRTHSGGAQSNRSAPGAHYDACKLLSIADVTPILGDGATQQLTQGGQNCEFRSADKKRKLFVRT